MLCCAVALAGALVGLCSLRLTGVYQAIERILDCCSAQLRLRHEFGRGPGFLRGKKVFYLHELNIPPNIPHV